MNRARGRKTDYAAFAADYLHHRRASDDVVAALIEHGGVTAASSVLEVGCGTGDYAIPLAAATRASCVGVDPSVEMLVLARRRASDVRFRTGRAEELPFADEEFDLVLAIDVVHHLDDLTAATGEAFRVLRPGGRLCIGTDDEETIRARLHAEYFPETVTVELERYPTVERIRARLAEARFVRVREQRTSAAYEVRDAAPYRDRVFSSLRLIPEEAFENGLARLEGELARGPIQAAARHVLVWATKP